MRDLNGPATENAQGDIFSHASQDRTAANRICRQLRGRGLKVWYSKVHLVGAEAWHDEIGEALDRCDWFVVLLTPDAVRSQWVKREIVYALSMPRYVGRIVPVILKDCNPRRLSWALKAVQSIDYRDTGIAGLLRVWGIDTK